MGNKKFHCFLITLHQYAQIIYFVSLFYVGVQPIDNVVIIPRGQQSDSVTHIRDPETPLPSKPPHNIEQSSLCHTAGPSFNILMSRL